MEKPMKFCKYCGKTFVSGNYCPLCGAPLEEVQYDIFGQPINYHVHKEKVQTDTAQENNVNTNPLRMSKEKLAEMLTFFGLGFVFLPIYGAIEIILSLVLNIDIYRKNKTHLAYLIVSLILLVLSIVWVFLLYKYKILSTLSNS